MIWRLVKGLALAAALAAPAAAQESAQGAEPVRPEGCVIEQWPAYLAPGTQDHHVRESLVTDAGEIYAVEFDDLEGEYAKLYLFFLVQGGCERKVLSVGSYGYMNDFARQRGEIGEGERVYHVDLFEPGERDQLEVRYRRPSYEAMREKALNLLR